MSYSIKEVLMTRDKMTAEEANAEIDNAKKELMERISKGEMPMDFCEERWKLEPDYLEDLLYDMM